MTSSGSTRYQPGGALASEDSPAIGHTVVPDAYVRSKVLEERVVAEFSRGTGLEVVVVLSGGLVSPRDASPTPLGAGILARLNGESSGGIGLKGVFPVVDVRDVARAHVAAMESCNLRRRASLSFGRRARRLITALAVRLRLSHTLLNPSRIPVSMLAPLAARRAMRRGL